MIFHAGLVDIVDALVNDAGSFFEETLFYLLCELDYSGFEKCSVAAAAGEDWTILGCCLELVVPLLACEGLVTNFFLSVFVLYLEVFRVLIGIRFGLSFTLFFFEAFGVLNLLFSV